MKEKYNRLLLRQITRHLNGQALSTELNSLLESISQTYDSYERDYHLIERAMDLSSEELFNSNKELRKINHELDKFVYSAAHDLRSPLTSIMALVNLAENNGNEEEVAEYLSLIQESSQKLNNVIEDIVDFSRNSRTEVKSELVEFNTLIEKTFATLKHLPGFDRIAKEIVVKNEIPFYNDSGRLSIVFNNLISNAIKYQSDKEKDSYVNINIDSSLLKVAISVEDNGIGINPKYIDRVFDMFFRASDISKGTGLGLYNVREIMTKLNGEISIESNPAQGTKVKLILPNCINQPSLNPVLLP